MTDWNIQGEVGINDLNSDLYDFSSTLVSSRALINETGTERMLNPSDFSVLESGESSPTWLRLGRDRIWHQLLIHGCPKHMACTEMFTL